MVGADMRKLETQGTEPRSGFNLATQSMVK